MSIFYWIIFGLITGTVTEFITPSGRGGIPGSIILGIIGAVVGSYLGQRFFGAKVTGFNIESFVVAVLGSLLVILIARIF